jgi:CheY-like chemotaxis protein
VTPRRFLVVDDTDDLRALMVRMVERAGHVAEEATDGTEAVELLTAHRYDVMLLDLAMPRMSGVEVVSWLNANPDRAEGLHTVVVSAWTGESRATLQELGVTSFLTKPFRLQQLAELIADLTVQDRYRLTDNR